MTRVDITTITTTVPTGDDNVLRMRKLAARGEDLRATGRAGYRMCSTVVIPSGDCVAIVGTLEREEIQP